MELPRKWTQGTGALTGCDSQPRPSMHTFGRKFPILAGTEKCAEQLVGKRASPKFLNHKQTSVGLKRQRNLSTMDQTRTIWESARAKRSYATETGCSDYVSNIGGAVKESEDAVRFSSSFSFPINHTKVLSADLNRSNTDSLLRTTE